MSNEEQQEPALAGGALSPEYVDYSWATNFPIRVKNKLNEFSFLIRETVSYWFLDLAFWIRGTQNSRYVNHALSEYKLAGVKPEREVMDLIRVHSMYGHSGGSHFAVLELFNHLINSNTLTPITDNPAEWNDVSKFSGYPHWQNLRNSACFSEDGGKTYQDINEDETPVHTSIDHTKIGKVT